MNHKLIRHLCYTLFGLISFGLTRPVFAFCTEPKLSPQTQAYIKTRLYTLYCLYDNRAILQVDLDDLLDKSLRGRYAFVDEKGDLVIPFQFEDASSFSDGLAAVKNTDEEWGFIDTSGKVVIPYQYQRVYSFSNGTASVQLSAINGSGIIDKTGKVIIPFEYDLVKSFQQGLALARKTRFDKFGYLNKHNQWAVAPQFNEAMDFLGEEGLAAVKINGLWGYINTQGENVIQPQYEDANEFSEGLAAVKSNGKFGFINRQNQLIIPFKFRYAEVFTNNRARVILDDEEQTNTFVDKQGKLIGYALECQHIKVGQPTQDVMSEKILQIQKLDVINGKVYLSEKNSKPTEWWTRRCWEINAKW